MKSWEKVVKKDKAQAKKTFLALTSAFERTVFSVFVVLYYDFIKPNVSDKREEQKQHERLQRQLEDIEKQKRRLDREKKRNEMDLDKLIKKYSN